MCDNTVLTYYINKQGHQSPSTCGDCQEYNSWAQTQVVSVRARFIPGKLSVLTDDFGRSKEILSTEWVLKDYVLESVWRLCHKPQVDLFATIHNHRLPIYVSPCPDSQALAVDVLSILDRPGWLCLFPNGHDAYSLGQYYPGQSRYHNDSLQVAIQEVVPEPTQPAGRGATKSPRTKISAQAVSQIKITISSWNAMPTCLEVVRGSLVAQGFSQQVADRVATSTHRTSTKKIYQSKWSKFVSWCNIKNINTLLSTEQDGAQFLLDLFNQGLALPTIGA
jgi:hypothetical protein